MIALGRAEAGYPVRLRDLERPPERVWIDGDASALDGPAVAIVGTRRMTGYGERVAHELAAACGASGIVVISGFAQGIDTTAHRGALDGGGRTVAVLGESIPTFLAATRGRRRPLIPRVRACGALVSEFASPFTPRVWTFAQRDATIAALAACVVVVEAPTSSGALITAGHARKLGRPLFAVPGPLGSVASVGTNALIANGHARALLGPDQLLRAVGVATASIRLVPPSEPLLALLADGPAGLDELARRSRLAPHDVTARVASLLLSGAVVATPDGRVRRA